MTPPTFQGVSSRTEHSPTPRRAIVVSMAFLTLLVSACGSFHAPNHPIDHIDPAHGYRPTDASRQREAGRIWISLFFSGGGTRAAAFAQGVLEGLRDTSVVIDGEERRLLDEVDSISGVSGGSFPAAYYGLFGDRVFDDFEARFLKQNVTRALVLRGLIPWNALRLLTPYYSRSDLASRYYHEHVFDRATFADLAATHGPRIYINATDLPSGTEFRFHQGAFDVICSDLSPFWISYAVAASSAVPVLLSPVTLRNYAGSCGFEPPDWFEEALEDRRGNPRGHDAARAIVPFLDSERSHYIHLVDGAISDNLGLRPGLSRLAAIGSAQKAMEIAGLEPPDHIVYIVVNAENEPDPAINLSSVAPSLTASLNLVTGAQIRRANSDTLLLADTALREFGENISTPEHQVGTHFVEVSFDLIEDDDERAYFKLLPTSFALEDEQVDRLSEAGGALLRESPQFRAFVELLE